MVELLRSRAADHPERLGYTFLGDGETETERLTYGELDLRARAVAALLRRSAEPGDRVVLLFPPGLDFVVAFFGCLYARMIAVPAYPPNFRKDASRLLAILRDAAPRMILSTAAIVSRARSAGFSELPWTALDEIRPEEEGWCDPGIDGATVALLQYTSGSTGDPKGVIVTHGNLTYNEEAIRRVFGQGERSIIVGWLPLYHDMGLIGNVLQPLWAEAQCVLMASASFLQRPRRWLEAISRYHATTSGGPNFAYDLCVRKVPPEERAGLDLSSWEVAFNGAEPVRSETLERFAAAFAPWGFSRRAFCPCYGLAEATLLVSGVLKGSASRTTPFDAAALERNRVAATQGSAATLVSSGVPLPDQQLVIVDPETGVVCEPGRVGEIWISGPGVAQGYWNRPEETERTFGTRLAKTGEGPFLRTGDLGFVEGGELFVTGRLKDLIILRGRNLYPQDIERTVEGSHPALRPGGGGAFSVDVEGEERLVVVHELDPRLRTLGAEETTAIAAAVRRAVAEEHEAQVHELVLIPAGGLPKTTSGKVRRRACRDMLLSGALERIGDSVLDLPGTLAGAVDLSPGALRAIDPGERKPVLERYLRESAARALRVSPDRVDPLQPLASLGLDSLSALELRHGLEAFLGSAPAIADLLQGASLASLAAELEARIEEAPGPGEVLLAPTGEEVGDHPASYGQKALWFVEQMAPGNGVYHIPVAVRVRGTLDAGALERALCALVERHPALRTVFFHRQGEVWQRVLAEATVSLRREDASGWSEADLAARLAEEASRPFSLERGPLLRAASFSRAAGDHVVSLVLHHIVCDFWSLGVLWRELGFFYQRETGGPPAVLAPLTARYTDFARWQACWLASPSGERAATWWEERLAGAPVLDLPTDRPRPPVQTYRGGAQRLRLKGGSVAGLQALAARRGATLFMTLLAGFQILLYRYSAQEDLVVGSPSVGRPSAVLADLVGYFVNPLPLRADLAGDLTFEELLERVRAATLAAFAHQDVPFAWIAARVQPERAPSLPPVFQAMLVLQRAGQAQEEGLAALALGEAGARVSLGGLPAESLARPSQASQLDLTLLAAALDGELSLCLEHNADLFDEATAGGMLRHFAALLAAIVEEPVRHLRDLPLLSPEEREEILRVGCAPPCDAPERPLHSLFAAQARRTPEGVAVVSGEERCTYAELEHRANQLACYLQRLGVGPEITVALATERSTEMVVGVLGVLKAGGAYVPLDPAYPQERLAFMLADSGAPVLLTQERLEPGLPRYGGRLVRLDRDWPRISAEPAEAPPCAAGPGNLAYLIYTSGSTGRPKGVAIEHRSPVSLVHWAREVFPPGELAGVLASTSICFDLSIFELFVPLAWGGTVILAANALELPRLPAACEVTLVNTVPSAMAELARSRSLPHSVRVVNLAGEPLLTPLVRQIEAMGTVQRILNLYGPSEDTTYSTWAPARGEGRPPTIGRPVRGTRAHVLGSALEPVPAGVPGELYLGGAGLARGYFGRPELTAERFLPDPWAQIHGEPGARLYRTGDLVRRLADGELGFIGRVDHQVKIRGHRVELGEVDAVLSQHPAVRQTATLLWRDEADGEARLVAYVAADGEERALRRELHGRLRAALPAAVQPSALVLLEALPLTPSGKIDHRALPQPVRSPVPDGGYAAPSTPVEELLAGIFAEVLGREQVGIQDDFFELGGHSLLAVRALARVEQTFHVGLPLGTLFQAPTVARLAERIAGSGAGRLSVAPPMAMPRTGALPLSFAQQRLWFLHQLEPGSAAYHIAGAVRLTGRVDRAALDASLGEIFRRHEALRSRFLDASGEPSPRIGPAPEGLRPALVDLGGLSCEGRRAEARRLSEETARQPFDLALGPVARLLLLRETEEEHRLVVVLHHIVSDGASLEIFLRELAALYGAFVAGRPSPLPDLPLQYADFAAWQRRSLSREALAGPLGWWKERLSGAPVLELPADRPRPPVQSDRGGLRILRLDAEGEAIRRLCRAETVTPYMALLAAFSAFLARLTGETDISVGAPVATRDRIETEGLIGLLINTLVLRADLGGDPEGREVLRRTRRTVLEAHARAEVPFEQVVDELQPERGRQRSPLFQVMFSHLSAASSRAEAGGLEMVFEEVDTGTAKFDLSLWVRETAGGLDGRLVYRQDLFEPATVARLEGHFLNLLLGLSGDPDRPLSLLPLLSAAERHQLLSEWNATEEDFPCDRCLHELFEDVAARQPEAPAVLTEGGVLSFREVNRRANRLARRLRALGVGPDVPVGLCADRSPETIVALVGIWKAGGAYVPLDPAYPEERLAYTLEDTRAPVLVARPELVPAPPSVTQVMLEDLTWPGSTEDDANPGAPVAPDHLAYILYTSGTTGRPKGTMVRHRSVVNLASALRRTVYAGRSGALRVGVNASLAFDASVKQLVQLVHGHALCVVPEEVRRDGRRLLRFLAGRSVGVLDCTPSQLRLLLAEEQEVEGGVPATVLVGGEAIDEALWRELAGHTGTEFWNVYGPTECTVDATAWRIAGDRPRLGRPIGNVHVHLLDRGLQPVPAGAPGEMFIGGAGLARGYWRRPDWTALAFVPDPFAAAPGARLYRTGDLARRLPDGTLDFLGRADDQVKVRGLRVELGEIESLLGEHPDVDRAVVLCRQDAGGGRRLVAYVRGGAGEGELRSWLRRRLPEAMVPSVFVPIERFPLTPSGKVDRRALPEPVKVGFEPGQESVAPRNPLEESLAAIWASVLGVERVGVRHSFFELGGHSLVAAQLVSRVRQACGVEVPLRVLFEAPTIEGLAAAIEGLRREASAAPVPSAAIQARRRGQRNLSQLLDELAQLSPEQAEELLWKGGSLRRPS